MGVTLKTRGTFNQNYEDINKYFSFGLIKHLLVILALRVTDEPTDTPLVKSFPNMFLRLTSNVERHGGPLLVITGCGTTATLKYM